MLRAKADEPLGDDTIGDYYDRTADSRSNVPARIRQLSSALFGRVPDAAIRKLRYQLLHPAAATLIEAAANKTEPALFLVHEFRWPKLNERKLPEQHSVRYGITKCLEVSCSLLMLPQRPSVQRPAFLLLPSDGGPLRQYECLRIRCAPYHCS